MLGACPSPNREGCPFMEQPEGCRSNTHHLFYPKRRYKTQLEKQFRELPENKEQLCMYSHMELHETEYPPEKPPLDQMVQALSRIAIEEAA